jgi:hypothetical protein
MQGFRIFGYESIPQDTGYVTRYHRPMTQRKRTPKAVHPLRGQTVFCLHCSSAYVPAVTGRLGLYCSTKCRVYAWREKNARRD